MTMSRRPRRPPFFRLIVTFFLLSATLLLGVVLWLSSTRLVVPERRPLEERHYEILADPVRYGMDLRPFEVTTHDGNEVVGIIANRATRLGEATRTGAMVIGRSRGRDDV